MDADRTAPAQHPTDPSASSPSAPDGPASHARRASSFGTQAAAYAEHRPDYPEAGVRWGLQPAVERHGGPGGVLTVLDLGAGTGKLTATLVALGHAVTAVEPDPAMLDELRRQVPAATALAGGAERIPLPDASVDAVVAGQAFHWFDQDRALPEIARVLRPGGCLAAVWNGDDDRVPWIAGLTGATLGRTTRSQWQPEGFVAPHPAFAPVEQTEFPHRQRRTRDSLVATIATHSSMLVLEPDARAAALARVRDYLHSRPETAGGTFDLELVTRVERCVRLPAA